MSLGEKGKYKGESRKPEEMKEIRRREFVTSMDALGAKYVINEYPDGELGEHRDEIKKRVLEITRENQFDVLFSFHPHEVTPIFDHPDHRVAGEATLYAGNFADVAGLYDQNVPALNFRPSTYLWTTAEQMATHAARLDNNDRNNMTEHYGTHYPSQFPREQAGIWGKIFERISRGTRGASKPREMYMEVR